MASFMDQQLYTAADTYWGVSRVRVGNSEKRQVLCPCRAGIQLYIPFPKTLCTRKEGSVNLTPSLPSSLSCPFSRRFRLASLYLFVFVISFHSIVCAHFIVFPTLITELTHFASSRSPHPLFFIHWHDMILWPSQWRTRFNPAFSLSLLECL
jgi:hypothetical protein